MALEKFVHGKVDSCRHEGKISELRRIAEAEAKLADYFDSQVEMQAGVIYNISNYGERKTIQNNNSRENFTTL